MKTRTPSAVAFRVVGDRTAKGAIKGDLEAKYSDPQNGFTFTQTWTTANVLKSNLELENNVAKGLKIDINTTLHPEKHSPTVSLATVYKQPGLNTRAHLDLFNVRAHTYSPSISAHACSHSTDPSLRRVRHSPLTPSSVEMGSSSAPRRSTTSTRVR